MTNLSDFDKIIIFIKKIHEKRDYLKNKYNWSLNKDARLAIFDTWINAANNITLSVIFYLECLKNNSWWLKYYNGIPENERLFREDQYESILRYSFCQFILQDIESSLRIILRAIDPSACSNGTANFESVYCFLLKQTNLKKHENTFKLMRLIRNTIHNNTFYFGKNSESVTFNGKEYKFEIGKPINFLSWDFIIELQDGLLDAINEMVDSSYVNSLPAVESTGMLLPIKRALEQ